MKRSTLLRTVGAIAFLSLLLLAALVNKGYFHKAPPKPDLTYETEIEAVRKKYEPVRLRHDQVLREQGVRAGVEFYDKHIKPGLAEINSVREKYGKDPLPQ